jgi:archaellum component FlaG (FlaF/FlaG flagellin family)
MKKFFKKGRVVSGHGIFVAALLLFIGCSEAGNGNVSISSKPSDAEIIVNGELQGRTPARLDHLLPGQYVIELRKEGFDTVYKSVALLEKQDLSVDLELKPTTGLLLVDSKPQGVDVLIDGVSRGRTPLVLSDLPLGSYKLDFDSPTHLPRSMEAAMKDRKPVLVFGELISNTATLVLASSPDGAQVFINGVARGTTPVTLSDVVAGRTDVKVARIGYEAYERQLDLEVTRTYEINAELEALPSGLTVITEPAGATVTMDGLPVGKTPCSVNAQDGSRVVEIALMGYDTIATNLMLKPSVTERLDLNLVKNSGTLVLDTEPAEVKVYINGELFAVTEPQGGIDAMSKPVNILLKAGEDHRIQLVREGYAAASFTLRTELDQLVTRHESLKRIFVRDTMITTQTEVIKCRLEYKLPNGNIYYERFPGVYDTAKAADILDVQEIDLSDESNYEARRLLERNRQLSLP